MELNAITLSKEQIRAFCRKHHICRLAFFGSVVRDDFTPQSDVDVLVEFETDHIPGFQFFIIQDELSKLISHTVDLQTAGFLNPEILKLALAEAVTVYEKA